MIKPGNYKGVIVDHTIRTAKNGTEYVVIKFEATDSDGLIHPVFWNGYFTEKTLERTKEYLLGLGFFGSNLGDLIRVDAADPVMFDSQIPFELVVEHETGDDGKPRARVRFINFNSGDKRPKSELFDLKQVVKSSSTNALFQDMFKKIKADKLKQTDDIPF